MEKFSDECRELQCVGRLEIIRPKPVGFLCGSIPVPTDASFHVFDSDSLRSKKFRAPWYRMLPTESDHNKLPLISNFTEKLLPVGASMQPNAAEGGANTSNMTGKCEALAVSGLVDYEDEIDVIAPTDILKQIFKMPYSKARLSIAVRRIGKTLVLNAGPDAEEGDKLNGRCSSFSKYADQSSFGNVPTHSVRMEACDCPPGLNISSNPQSSSSVVPGPVQTNNSSEVPRDLSKGTKSQFSSPNDDIIQTEALSRYSEYTHARDEDLHWKSNNKKINKGYVTKASSLGEEERRSVQESERYKRVGKDEFLRVLFWQFYNFRMLLGSDLLLFSNEKFVAVSLHLCDILQKVSSLTWLDFWLDNVMASVPELAICYHENGVVKGYELLKTDDIFLLKGIAEDGTPAFHPHVVQQNGLAVLRFLQENCKQDPGAYWLYKTGGEDAIQLFDLSAIPPDQPSANISDETNSLPSSVLRGRSECLFALGMLLYRVAHRFSLLMGPNRSKCAKFFKKCLDFLYEPDHMVVRASAHEQFARLLLNNEEELDFSSDSLLAESEFLVSDGNEVTVDLLTSCCGTTNGTKVTCLAGEGEYVNVENHFEELTPEVSSDMTIDVSKRYVSSHKLDSRDDAAVSSSSSCEEVFALCDITQQPAHVIPTVSDPVSSKLAAIHHVQQAIKSLRMMREHQGMEPESVPSLGSSGRQVPCSYSVCACGDSDCIEVCDIRAWLPTSKLDHKLWKLVLLLGESYLALGQANKEDGQLYQALKVVGLACSLYGSMPQHFGDTKFISTLATDSTFKTTTKSKNQNAPIKEVPIKIRAMALDEHHSDSAQQFSSVYLFWAKAWMLIGDIFVEFHIMKGKESPKKPERNHIRELRMSSEVVKEVERLKNKVGQLNPNCESCSLVNCSCQNDRASSGSSATSSAAGADTRMFGHGKKQNKKLNLKGVSNSSKNPDANHVHRVSDQKKTKLDLKDQFIGRPSGVLSQECNGIDIERVEMAIGIKGIQDNPEVDNCRQTIPSKRGTTPAKDCKVKSGGIFKYLECTFFQAGHDYLTAASDCFGEAKRALCGISSDSSIWQAVIKKRGWVCNELGRYWLDRKELDKAEVAFADAVESFKEASDHTNIILISLNLGHGRRALAEETVSKMEALKKFPLLQTAYSQAIVSAKREYRKSIEYYGAAKLELNYMAAEAGDVYQSLRNDVYTQFANTYLRLGMLLAKEQLADDFSEGALEDGHKMHNNSCEERYNKEPKKNDMTANEALREALSLYESLGDLRKQEAAYAYFQIGCHQRDRCLKFLASDNSNLNVPKGENTNLQRAKQYFSLAERNWQRALDFYGPKSHAAMYLAILMERAALLLSFTSSVRSNTILETALLCLLDGRNICDEIASGHPKDDIPDLYSKFWSQLQLVLKKLLSSAMSVSGKKSALHSNSNPNRSKEVAKLKELYKMALKSTDFIQLYAMHQLWTS
uniref:EDRF1 N-terminal domain-containing protein n=2 Tax=Kalanchoe fedtschenkoi TaxID=63787 RepID=A0A7N0VNL3_KALFE